MRGEKKQRKNRIILLRLAAIALPAVVLTAMLSQTAFAKTCTGVPATGKTTAAAKKDIPGEDPTSRVQTVSIRYHGEMLEASASGETVEALLTRLGLAVESGDALSHAPSATVRDGMTVFVDSFLTRQETYTAALPHEINLCQDASIPAGMEEILIEGVDGEVMRIAEVTYINGKEVQRKILTETVTIAPVTEIVAVGTGITPQSPDPGAMPVIGDGYILLPTGETLTYTDTATVRATAYTHTDAGCDFITSTGSVVHWGTVAVDPRYIPYGTRMFIVASDGSYIYGIAEAEDCGGAIKGDRMDLYMPTFRQCIEFGRRTCTVYFLG